MKDIELIVVSPPGTTVPNMEMSLSPVGRKSEQDPTASRVGGQPPHCSLGRKYVDAPAVSRLTFVPPAAAATPPPGWGSPHAYPVCRRRGRNVEHSEKKTLFCAH